MLLVGRILQRGRALKRLHLLDHADVGLHVHHVAVPPVVLEAQHQGVRLEAAEARRLEGEGWKAESPRGCTRSHQCSLGTKEHHDHPGL